VIGLTEENARLWKLLEEDLTRVDDPWDQVDRMLGVEGSESESDSSEEE